jgi:hypothetical protein
MPIPNIGGYARDDGHAAEPDTPTVIQDPHAEEPTRITSREDGTATLAGICAQKPTGNNQLRVLSIRSTAGPTSTRAHSILPVQTGAGGSNFAMPPVTC